MPFLGDWVMTERVVAGSVARGATASGVSGGRMTPEGATRARPLLMVLLILLLMPLIYMSG